MPRKLTEIIEKSSQRDRIVIDYDSLSAEDQLAIYKAERYKSNTENRKWLAEWAVVIVTLWLFSVLLILFTNFSQNLKLSDTVLSVLLGTTTLNVLGLMFIVLKGYFSGDEKL